jgi:hypothetical protein
MRKVPLYLSLFFFSLLLPLFHINSAEASRYVWNILAKASPDECFYSVGNASNQWPMTMAPGECTVPGEPQGQLKRNEAYIWGLAEHEGNIFFGTGQNIHCLVIQGYLGSTEPILNDGDYVCEFGSGPAPFNSDNRPPSLYMHKAATGLTRFTFSGNDEFRRLRTGGIRSAGAHPDGIVFLAGPGRNLSGTPAVNFFAFNGATGEFLGSYSDEKYTNIRKWLLASDGYLYFGVGSGEAGVGGETQGAVLRWKGNPELILAGQLETLFDFETVATGLDGDAAELTEHEGRLFVTTWPKPGFPAGLWMSPALNEMPAPLGVANLGWSKKWSAIQYDPDPVTAQTYGGGAVASFGGWVYWGTMHVPGVAARTQLRQDIPATGSSQEIYLGTWRSVSIFRGRGFGTDREQIELLYGGSPNRFLVGSGSVEVPPGHFPKYDRDDVNPSWKIEPNRLGSPRYGRGGFGNHYNNYTWTMKVYNNKLFVGTMDHSYLLKDQLFKDQDPQTLNGIRQTFGTENFGADLWVFDNADSPAKAVSQDGMGNPTTYGIRTMIESNGRLLLGMANPMNLNPDGGWELISLNEPSGSSPSGSSGCTLGNAEFGLEWLMLLALSLLVFLRKARSTRK